MPRTQCSTFRIRNASGFPNFVEPRNFLMKDSDSSSSNAWRTRIERCHGLGDPPDGEELRRWTAEFDALPLARRNAVLALRTAVHRTLDTIFGFPTASLVPDFLENRHISRLSAVSDRSGA